MAAANTIINGIRTAMRNCPDIMQIMASDAMTRMFITELISLYSMVYDSRVPGMCDYDAAEVLTAVHIGALCGKNTWTELDVFMKNRQEWCFEHFPSMRREGKTPSHDTLNRIFSKLDEEQLQIAQTTFIQENIENLMKRYGCEKPEYNVTPLDGKVEKGTGRSYNEKAGGEVKDLQTLHIYDAATCTTIAAISIAEKTNEIPTAREFLEEMDTAVGKIFTGDAMHAQKLATSIITEKGGDYCFGTKGNQKLLLQNAVDLFTPEIKAELKANGFYRKTVEKAHGCIEVREYYTALMGTYSGINLEGWTNLNSITLCESTSTPLHEGEPKKESRYYISSLVDPDVIPKVIRGHWTIESQLHETMDKAFLCDANTTMNWTSVNNLFSIFRASLPMIYLAEPMVFGQSVKIVRQSLNDDFANSLRKLSWLFDPTLGEKIRFRVAEKFARLEMLRKRREERSQEAKAA